MRKWKTLTTAIAVCLCAVSAIGYKSVHVHATEGSYYVGGMTAGFLLGAGGIQIIGFNDVRTKDGERSPARDVGLCVGDMIVEIDGVSVTETAQLNQILERCEGRSLRLTVERNGERASVEVSPAQDRDGKKYKLGIVIRDTVSGIGTITYIERETGKFGALGHSVSDEKGTPLSVAGAKVYLCSIIGVNRGCRGKAGELRGLFLNDKTVARAEKITSCGLFGVFEGNYDFSYLQTVEAAPVAEAEIGEAVIYSTVDGTQVKEYDVAIAKVDAQNKDRKNFVIKIVDKELIEETGGIVQGMSGSPILQNGKLIGAVTHVFLNDPTRGYGISIEHMIDR